MRVELHHGSTLLYSGQLDEFTQPVLIGRSNSCQWRTPGEAIRLSSRHARLMREGSSTLILEDLKSTNGTFDSRGNRIDRVTLKPGMVIHLGECTMTISQGNQHAPATPSVWIAMGPFEGKRFPITPGTHVIGSGEDAKIRIQDPIVSAHHAQLAITPDGKATLMDLGSTNGTLIGSRPLQPQTPVPLKSGKLFFVAHHGLKYSPTGKETGGKPIWILGGVAALVACVTISLAVLKKDKVPDPGIPPGNGAQTGTPATGQGSPTVQASLPPDFAKLGKDPALPPAEVSLLKELWGRFEKVTTALLASPAAASADAFNKLAAELAPGTFSPPLEPWRELFHSQVLKAAKSLEQSLPPVAPPPALELWRESGDLEKVLAVDTLGMASHDLGGEPTSLYDRWLGARRTYKELFDRSGRLIFTPLPDGSFTPDTTRLVQRHGKLAAVVAWIEEAGVSLPAAQRVTVDAWKEELASRRRLLKKLTEQAKGDGRTALVAAILLERLTLPGETSATNTPLQKMVDDAFAKMLDRIDELDAQTESPSRPLQEIRKEILAAGLPGDKVVDRAWAGSSAP